MKLRYSAKPPEAEIASLFSLWMEELFELDDKAVYLDADLMPDFGIRDRTVYSTAGFKRQIWSVLPPDCF